MGSILEKCCKMFVVYLKMSFALWTSGHGFHHICGIMGRISSNMGGIIGPDLESK